MYKVVSESELQRIFMNWDTAEVISRPILFQNVMWSLGIDVRHEIECQEGLTHRNTYGDVVKCLRWVGLERTDRDWLNSDKCSIEAQYLSADPSVKIDMQALMGRDCSALLKQDREELSLTLENLGQHDITR